MKKVLITGVSGFVGMNLANELVKRNYLVSGIDIIKSKNLDKNIKFIKKDINALDLYKTFKNIDTVFHTAAVMDLGESLENPEKYFKINVLGTINVLDSALKAKVKRVVYSSSSSIYGDRSITPQKENLLPDPQNPYALSKLIGEYYMRVWSKNYGIETVSLRYFNFYGPKDFNNKYKTVIDIFLDNYQLKKDLLVEGGSQERSFLFISDLVKANILAMKSGKVGKGEVINIGLDKSYKIIDIAKMISPNIKKLPAKKGKDILVSSKTLPDISKAKQLLNWKPAIYLKEGIEIMKKGLAI